MGYKCTSNDADLMQPNQYIISKKRWAKIPLPESWSPPDFEVPFAKALIECTSSNWLVSYCAYINSVRDSGRVDMYKECEALHHSLYKIIIEL